MEVAILIVIAVVLVVAAKRSPFTRRLHDARDAESRRRYDIDREFKRPPNEGDLL